MSLISQLVVLAAFAYAMLVIFVVVLVYLPLVSLSVRLYRLLLAAYPASFRMEYGPEMVQVFRDTVRAEYRRSGLWGLLVIWLRTLMDFSVSVVRQHREQPVAAPSSESVLLRDLLRQWRQFGAATLSTTAFSAWYVLHLLHLFFQRAVLVWATFTAIAFGIWLGSFFDSFHLMRQRTSRVDIGGGLIRILHADIAGEPITDEQWQRDTRAWRENNPALCDCLLSTPKPWEFRFVSDIPGATVLQYGPDRKTPAIIQPYKEWRLLLPFFPVPAVLLLGTVCAYRRRHAVSKPAMQSA